MTLQIIRNVSQLQIGATTDYQIIRSPSGPRGLAAGQDVGWTLSIGLGAGEKINSPPLPHAATFVEVYAHSDSGFQVAQTLSIHQIRAGSVIASTTLGVGSGTHDWTSAISAPGLVCAAGDVFQLVLPNPADGQCTDLSVSLGSTP
jgi:hypothetical protein